MIRKAIILGLLFASAVLVSAAKQKKSEGAITGVVSTEDGRAATNFRVCTLEHRKYGGMEQTQTCCLATTNSEGQFTIEHLKPGTYEVLAINDTEGYSLGNQSPGQDVTINQKNPSPNITLQLHNKGAIVVAAITDKNTGKPLRNAVLEYTGIDCEAVGNILRDFEGRYYLAVPPNCNVVLIARTKGYRGWIYTDPANPSAPFLRLQPGERKAFDIQLEALPQ